MKLFRVACFGLIVSLLGGCATSLNSVQKSEYNSMVAANKLIEEKDPTSGALFGLLPGGGSFYARETGFGIANLLLWPLSILWDPVSGYEGSKVINYNMTKQKLKKEMDVEMSSLDDKLTTNQINNNQYVIEKNKISKKYDFN